MRYKIAEIEDQIIATLQADTTNFSGSLVAPHTGEVTQQMFFNPEYMQNMVRLLPFVLLSYKGRAGTRDDRDSSGKTYIHTLTFRLFVGAVNARGTKEATRTAYDMLAGIFDDLHGKVCVTNSQQLTGYTPMSGTALTAGAVLMGPLFQTGGADEQLVVALPGGVVVYRTDYSMRVVA